MFRGSVGDDVRRIQPVGIEPIPGIDIHGRNPKHHYAYQKLINEDQSIKINRPKYLYQNHSTKITS